MAARRTTMTNSPERGMATRLIRLLGSHVRTSARLAVLWLCMVAVPSADARAQSTASISGVITDARSKLPLANVSVVVTGTRFGTQSAADGRYRITGVGVGA